MTNQRPVPEEESFSTVPWKAFLITTLESIFAFYIATFCFAMIFIHRGKYAIIDLTLMGILYAFITIVCAWRVLQKLSLATVMLIVPIAPFVALTIVISMIPLLQFFRI